MAEDEPSHDAAMQVPTRIDVQEVENAAAMEEVIALIKDWLSAICSNTSWSS